MSFDALRAPPQPQQGCLSMPNSAVVLHDSQNRQDNKTSCGMELLEQKNEDDDDGKLYEFSKNSHPIRELMQASASYLTMLLPH